MTRDSQYHMRVAPVVIESVWAHLVVSAISMMLLWLAFPEPAWGWLAHLALVPGAVLAIRSTRAKRLFWSTYVVSLVWWFTMIHWIAPVTVGGYVALSVYLALYTPAALLTVRWLHQRLRWPLFWILPTTWVSFEVLRGRLLAGGFGWFALGQSQVPWPPVDDPNRLIQIADVFGETGLSLLVAMTNGLIADLIIRRPVWPRLSARFRVVRKFYSPAGIWIIAVLGSWSYGQYRIDQTADTTHLGSSISTVQTNVPQDNKIHPTPDQQDRDFERMMDLTRRAAAGSPAPHMIVWPETMVPAALNPEAVDHFRMTRSGWGGSERYHHAIQSLARDLAVHLLVGANSHLDWTVATAKDGQRYEVPGRRFNSAFLYGSDGKQAKVRYDKIHRVPFGEYIPWVERLPRVKDLFLRFISPYSHDYTLQPGQRFTVLEMRTSQRLRLASPICFEDTVGRVCRRMIYARTGEKRADLLINLTNDGWFVGTSQGAQHFQQAVLRCVELRVPMVRSVNTGISGFIDSIGRVGPLVQEGGRIRGIEGFATKAIELDNRRSVYGRITGDTLAAFLPCLTAIMAIISYFCRSNRSG